MEVEKGTEVGARIQVGSSHREGVVVYADAERMVIELEDGERIIAFLTQKAQAPPGAHREIGS